MYLHNAYCPPALMSMVQTMSENSPITSSFLGWCIVAGQITLNKSSSHGKEHGSSHRGPIVWHIALRWFSTLSLAMVEEGDLLSLAIWNFLFESQPSRQPILLRTREATPLHRFHCLVIAFQDTLQNC